MTTKIRDLVKEWSQSCNGNGESMKTFDVNLPVKEAARIMALSEMFPNHTPTQIINDLLMTALRELETSFPYVEGDEVIGQDELGDPLYEDVGPTPKYLELAKKHLNEFRY